MTNSRRILPRVAKYVTQDRILAQILYNDKLGGCLKFQDATVQEQHSYPREDIEGLYGQYINGLGLE